MDAIYYEKSCKPRLKKHKQGGKCYYSLYEKTTNPSDVYALLSVALVLQT